MPLVCVGIKVVGSPGGALPASQELMPPLIPWPLLSFRIVCPFSKYMQPFRMLAQLVYTYSSAAGNHWTTWPCSV